MVPSLDLLTKKKLKDILDVTTNVVVVVFAVVAIGVLVKNYFAPDVKTSVAIKTEPSFRRSRVSITNRVLEPSSSHSTWTAASARGVCLSTTRSLKSGSKTQVGST